MGYADNVFVMTKNGPGLTDSVATIDFISISLIFRCDLLTCLASTLNCYSQNCRKFDKKKLLVD